MDAGVECISQFTTGLERLQIEGVVPSGGEVPSGLGSTGGVSSIGSASVGGASDSTAIWSEAHGEPGGGMVP